MGCLVSKPDRSDEKPPRKRSPEKGPSWMHSSGTMGGRIQARKIPEMSETGDQNYQVLLGPTPKEPRREESVVLLDAHRGSPEAAAAAVGWPEWLVSVAGEALAGWVPRRESHFVKLHQIGRGTFSSVFKARDLLDEKIVALKKVRFDTNDSESIKIIAREIIILRKLDHPNIIKLEGVMVSQDSSSIYLVFEYMDHDLAGFSSLHGAEFSEPQVKCYMKQLLTGLDHCHSHHILHRDIKSSNILIDGNGILKIADFGLATFFDPKNSVPLTTHVVTLWYRAPELLLGAFHYDVGVDLWSTGCVLGELYAGKPILPGKSEAEQLHKIFELCGSPSEDYWRKLKLPFSTAFRPTFPYGPRIAETFKNFPAPVISLLETLLSIDPDSRGTAASALESEYFRTEPFPCDPSCLPKYPPSKEIDAEMRGKGARKQDSQTRRVAKPPSVADASSFATPTQEQVQDSDKRYDDSNSFKEDRTCTTPDSSATEMQPVKNKNINDETEVNIFHSNGNLRRTPITVKELALTRTVHPLLRGENASSARD
ncbi:PREDICTED: probable serine/threonine-protein kinase At1g54610 isoform X2 [Tarenaya hassleriana]|uniref:probable serine/threonine-protein kinase At1g54610 isoform X2 n=1 Tax=Tarenaya hassleriana TaxID=28532 RepID=UPI00053C637D|nr:PREDICTED: probable serine/threonine-protein kinase At1g54610 isoform X2 [Tarenaya hassleriana]